MSATAKMALQLEQVLRELCAENPDLGGEGQSIPQVVRCYESSVWTLREYGTDSQRFEEALQSFEALMSVFDPFSVPLGIFSEPHFQDIILPCLRSGRRCLVLLVLYMAKEWDRSRPLTKPTAAAVLRQLCALFMGDDIFLGDGDKLAVLVPLLKSHLSQGPNGQAVLFPQAGLSIEEVSKAHYDRLGEVVSEAGMVPTLLPCLARRPPAGASPADRATLAALQRACCALLRSALLGLRSGGNQARRLAVPAERCFVAQYDAVVPRLMELAEEELAGPPGAFPDALSLLSGMANVPEVAERMLQEGLRARLQEHLRRPHSPQVQNLLMPLVMLLGTFDPEVVARLRAHGQQAQAHPPTQQAQQQRQRQQQQQQQKQQQPAGPSQQPQQPVGPRSGGAAGAGVRRECCACCGVEAGAGGGAKLKRCSGCRKAYFCGEECQKRYWPEHKAVCKAAQALARERCP